jgi:hypothetical protein
MLGPVRALVLICLAACGFEHGALSGNNKDASPDVPDDVTRTWTVDPTSGKAAPSTSSEWADFIAANALAIPAPDSIWLFDDASGAVTDREGTVDLASIGNTPASYRVTVSGWTRPAIGAPDAAGVAFSNTLDAALPTIGTSSLTVLLFYATATPPNGLRTVLVAGCCAGYVDVSIDSNAHFILSASGSQATGTTNHLGQVIPLIVKLDHSASRQVLIADKELLSLTSALGNYKGIFLGAANHAAPDGRWMYMTAWYGPSAEISDEKLNALVTALGW